MKKIQSLSISLLMILSIKAVSQDVKAPFVAFGIKAGTNIADITVKPSDNSFSHSALVGGMVGVFATIPALTNGQIQMPACLVSRCQSFSKSAN